MLTATTASSTAPASTGTNVRCAVIVNVVQAFAKGCGHERDSVTQHNGFVQKKRV